MTRLAILVYHRIGQDGAFHDVSWANFMAQLDLVRRRTGGPELMLTFDDGTADHWQAAEILEAVGLRGLFFVPAATMDSPGRLTTDQVRQMSRRGHGLGSHGMTHRRFDRMTVAECETELVRSQRILTELAAAPIRWLAPPGGICRPDLGEMAARAGFGAIRTMNWGYADTNDLATASALPVTRRTSAAAFQRMIDGDAPGWRWPVKRAAKALAGEALWTWLRERFG